MTVIRPDNPDPDADTRIKPQFMAGADIRAGEWVTVDHRTGTLVPEPYDGRREPAEDQTVIALLCQTLERTGFRTMNGETFEEWARARVRAGDYPEKVPHIRPTGPVSEDRPG